MAITPSPRSAASGKMRASTSRSWGLYGTWTQSIRPVRITSSSSSNADEL
jgi:hypothetical protein